MGPEAAGAFARNGVNLAGSGCALRRAPFTASCLNFQTPTRSLFLNANVTTPWAAEIARGYLHRRGVPLADNKVADGLIKRPMHRDWEGAAQAHRPSNASEDSRGTAG